MAALGESFRTARESQGLSLSDVADRIHIRSVYLAAIESEDWQSIGPLVYVKGFVRSYARFLRLDPDAAVARLNEPSATGSTLPAAAYAAPSREIQRPGGTRPLRDDVVRRGPSVWVIAGAIVAALLVAFAGYEYFAFRQGEAAAGAGSAARLSSAAGDAQPSPQATALEAPARAQPELRAAAKNVTRSSGFAVRLKDSSWLRVTVDGKVAMEGLYAAGTSRAFSGRSATVRVGNAGGVDITVDGKDLGPMGGLGDVAERSFQL